jgi:hypothetical protein
VLDFAINHLFRFPPEVLGEEGFHVWGFAREDAAADIGEINPWGVRQEDLAGKLFNFLVLFISGSGWTAALTFSEGHRSTPQRTYLYLF